MRSMTEETAAKKWCPFARSYEDRDTSVTVNRSNNGVPDKWCLCLTADCMAWRWDDTSFTTGYCGLVRGE